MTSELIKMDRTTKRNDISLSYVLIKLPYFMFWLSVRNSKQFKSIVDSVIEHVKDKLTSAGKSLSIVKINK